MFLQIASLRDNTAAVTLEKQIAKLGVNTFVQSYQTDKIQWYRVMAGPYANLSLAKQTQSQLQQKHINSLLLRIKTD